MEPVYLNPFALIERQDTKYYICLRAEERIRLSEKSAAFLLSKTKYSMKEFKENLEPGLSLQLLESGCVIPFQFNLNSSLSRTNGYFFQLGALDAYQQAKEKRVVLLGADALTSELGQGLCSFGVKRFTILDCDDDTPAPAADVGSAQVEALIRKLRELNPRCESAFFRPKPLPGDVLSVLSDIRPDLVVRGIETPPEFSHQVFSACEELGIPYISGGIRGTKTLIGPTYVPGLTAGHAESLSGSEDKHTVRLHGSEVTTDFSVRYLASELLIDAIKILMGKTDLVKYGSTVRTVDHFASAPAKSRTDSVQLFLLLLLSVLLAGAAAIWGGSSLMVPLSYFMLATLIAALWHRNPQQMYFNALLSGAAVGCTGLLLHGIKTAAGDNAALLAGSVPGAVFMFILRLCLHGMLFVLITALERCLFRKLQIR